MGKKKDRIIPKRIAGVKLPKQLRRTGEALLTSAQSPQGRAMLVAGLGMLAGRAADAPRAAAAEPPLRPGETRDPPPDPVKVAQTVGIVAEAVLGRLFTGGKG